MNERAAVRPLTAPFWASAALVVSVCALVLRTPLYARSPEMAGFGVTFDLCLTIPALYWLLVVRRGAHPASLIPVFGGGMLLARLLVPRGEQDFLRSLAPLGSLLELVLLAVVFVRVRKTSRSLRAAPADPVARIRIACEGIFGEGRLAGFLSAEISVLWFALFSWKRRAEEEGITFHRASGWGTVLAGLFVLIAGEGLGVHLLLARWSVRAAWTFTALDVYGVLWFLGDFQALRLVPTAVDGRTLRLRFGMRWSADVDAADVLSVSPIAPGGYVKSRDTLRFALLDEPTHEIVFREPVVFRGMA
ncbi:MAG TPA: hypothetical protein VG777_00475, partial [Thermoanaerobaculia bacterium]|nr:hypothetical protein [Thermoanaerobaculia bacterium]